ncbi:MAG TPA: hypothetical protein DCM86_05340, partial [Verrucomicrobiales bacterium]|nr:hypothetical protein [Verrucomicrobiales bacterium]
ELPTVRTQDPWANQPIGIRLLSTVGAQLQGGYWDLDNIRLREIRAPVLGLRPAGGEGLALSVESETGLVLEILGAGRLDAPPGGWVPLTTVTNESGRVPVPIPAAQEAAWYYRARELGAE